MDNKISKEDQKIQKQVRREMLARRVVASGITGNGTKREPSGMRLGTKRDDAGNQVGRGRKKQ